MELTTVHQYLQLKLHVYPLFRTSSQRMRQDRVDFVSDLRCAVSGNCVLTETDDSVERLLSAHHGRRSRRGVWRLIVNRIHLFRNESRGLENLSYTYS